MEKLRAENIKKSYGTETIIEGISISLHEGELVGLLGVSGVGTVSYTHLCSC